MNLPEPKYEVTDDGKHRYSIRHPDGTMQGPLVSVTKVIGILDKPALIGWAAREAAAYFKAEMLRKGRGALDPQMLEAIAKDAAMAHKRKAETAADLGTRLHDIYEAIVKGQEPSEVPPECVEPIRAFKEYRLQSDVEVVATEVAVASAEYGFGGRIDFVGYSESRGGWGIGDYKTSSGFYGNEYAIQAGGGYAIGLSEMYGVEVKWAEIARFSKKPPFESEGRPVTEMDAAKRLFLLLLEAGKVNSYPMIGSPTFSSAGQIPVAAGAPATKTKSAKKATW